MTNTQEILKENVKAAEDLLKNAKIELKTESRPKRKEVIEHEVLKDKKLTPLFMVYGGITNSSRLQSLFKSTSLSNQHWNILYCADERVIYIHSKNKNISSRDADNSLYILPIEDLVIRVY